MSMPANALRWIGVLLACTWLAACGKLENPDEYSVSHRLSGHANCVRTSAAAIIESSQPAQRATTRRWKDDRAAMLDYIARPGHTNSVVYPGAATEYVDSASGTRVLVGSVNPNQRARIVFGDDAGNELAGYGKGDRLYGGGGSDTLIGNGGEDYLEGNAGADCLNGGAGHDSLLGGEGDDTYVIDARDGTGLDTILDADGLGRILVIDVEGNTCVLDGGRRQGDSGPWISADGRFTYTLVDAEHGQQDLLVSGAGIQVRILHWSDSRSLGIALPEPSRSLRRSPSP